MIDYYKTLQIFPEAKGIVIKTAYHTLIDPDKRRLYNERFFLLKRTA